MFDANYPVHFVVADESDAFFTNSGLQLTVFEYVALELGNDWAELLFLRDGADGPCVYSRKNELLDDFTKAGWGKSSKAVCSVKLMKVLKESKPGNKTAIVADLDSFCRLIEDDVSVWQKAIGTMGSNRGMLILIIPQAVDAALPYLTNPQGLFLQEGKNPVCPKLSYLHSLGEEMFKNLKGCEQFSFISELNSSACKNLLICALLEQREIFPLATEISDGAVLLKELCINKEFRRKAGLMKDLAEMPRFNEIFTWLCHGKNLEGIFDLLAKLNEERNNRSLSKTIEAFAGSKGKLQLIKRTDPLVLDFCSINYPPSFCDNPNQEIAQQLSKAQEMVYYPRTTAGNKEISQWLQVLIKTYREGCLIKDSKYISDVLRAMCFVAQKLYIADNKEIDLLKNHREGINVWLTLSLKSAQECKKLSKLEAMLNENASERLYYQVKEQQVTVSNWQEMYDNATAAVMPMLSLNREITLSEATDIIKTLQKLSLNIDKPEKQQAVKQEDVPIETPKETKPEIKESVRQKEEKPTESNLDEEAERLAKEEQEERKRRRKKELWATRNGF